MKLIETKRIQCQIEVLTGLHIGAGKDAIEIGGIDSPVVKHPHRGEPYIPGSSLKGKLRCLMEWASGRVAQDGKIWDGGGETDPAKLALDPVLRIFGTTQEKWDAGPTRLMVRDAFLNIGWLNDTVEKGLPLTEEKFENNIDRIQGKAGKGIRKTERVPAGALFEIEMIYRIFDTGDGGKTDEAFLEHLFQVMRLLEQDALGGSGSRGYGRIRFQALKMNGEDIQARFDKADPTLLSPQERAA
jgi:CRISPR-associated protein Csm3